MIDGLVTLAVLALAVIGWLGLRALQALADTAGQLARQLVAPAIYVPRDRACECANCGAYFALGPETCPGCGGATWILLARNAGGRWPDRERRSR